MYEYRLASSQELSLRWEINIVQNPGDERWVAWKPIVIANNTEGISKTFVVMHEGVPVGEGTLIFSPLDGAINGRTALADGATTVNINALRMDKPYEGKGHMSKLVKVMEQYSRDNGYQIATIGVEPWETRNLGMYLHWGYDRFVMSEIENGDLVLYYSKVL